MSQSLSRRGASSVLIGALVVYAWLAAEVYRLKQDRAPAGDPPRVFSGWVLGPPGSALSKAAEHTAREGLDVLAERSRPPAERVRAYRERLAVVESLLERSLRADPAQPRALSQLAAVEWELRPPVSPREIARQLERIELASRMAPNVPVVQLRLGRLLLEMNRHEEAMVYFRRTLDLAPQHAATIASVLRQRMMSPTAIQDALGDRAETLVALRQDFLDQGLADAFLTAVERRGDRLTTQLLRAYARTCLETGRPERLRDRMGDIGPFERHDLEAERWSQRARAHAALGQFDLALEDARAALARQPASERFLEELGDLALLAQDGDTALRSYRSALGRAAARSGPPATRARLYRKIGQAEDLLGRPDRAYDAYRRALALDPREPFARSRAAELEARAHGPR